MNPTPGFVCLRLEPILFKNRDRKISGDYIQFFTCDYDRFPFIIVIHNVYSCFVSLFVFLNLFRLMWLFLDEMTLVKNFQEKTIVHDKV